MFSTHSIGVITAGVKKVPRSEDSPVDREESSVVSSVEFGFSFTSPEGMKGETDELAFRAPIILSSRLLT